MNEQLGFYGDVLNFLTEDELNQYLTDEKNFYSRYAKEKWLKLYHVMEKRANTTHLHKITSVLSDMPLSGGGNNKSDTEKYALKSVEAQERLDFFHECLNTLPPELQEVIEMTYIKRNSAGKKYDKTYIYQTLGWSRPNYFRYRKQAEYELGLFLFQYEVLKHEGNNHEK